VHPGEIGPVALHEGDQQRPVVAAPDARLDSAQDLVVVQQADVLDVDVVDLALDAHQADHVLAAAGQALGGAVRDVAEFLDGLPDPGPGGFSYPVLAVHHPGDGGRGHTGQPRDVVESYHFLPIRGIAGIPCINVM